ncbi:hypothetical protein [Gloeobacter violaceus]|uniref:hypothetical protein n=1 Tax=Gloeobacter violaceus TaxID=33072 RepID=UPI0013E8C56A|nr:hypothetical protein [Gloeobacter violaceus]
MALSSVHNSILVESCEDYVGLWSVVWHFHKLLKQHDSTKIRYQTLQIIEELLREGLIQAGSFSSDGSFVVWEIQPIEVIKRIENEWDALGRDPNLGEIAWFEATEKGALEASRIKN